MINEEKEIFDAMDTVTEDEMMGFLETADMNLLPECEEADLTVIRQKAFAKAGISSVRKKNFWSAKGTWKLTAAAILVLCVGMSVLGPGRVWAEVKKILEYIPGWGIALEKQDGGERWVLPQPVEVKAGQEYVKLMAAMADDTGLQITFEGTMGIAPDKTTTSRNIDQLQVRLIDAQGKEHTSGNSSMGVGSKWIAFHSFGREVKMDAPLRLIVEGEQRVEIPFILQKADSYESYYAMGPTVKHNGLQITAIPAIDGDKVKATLVALPQKGVQIRQYGRYPQTNQKYDDFQYTGLLAEEVMLRDQTGREYTPLNPGSWMGVLNEFTFTAPLNQSPYTLHIPYVRVQYEDSKTVSFPIPRAGEVELHRSIQLAGFTLDLIKAIRVDDKTVEVLVDTHYDDTKAESLIDVRVEPLTRDRSTSGEYSRKDQSLYKFRIYTDTSASKAKVRFSQPETIRRGPWDFTLDLVPRE